MEDHLKRLTRWMRCWVPNFVAWAGLMVGILGNYAAGAFLLLASLYFETMEFRPIDLQLSADQRETGQSLEPDHLDDPLDET